MKQKVSIGILILITLIPLVSATPAPTVVQWGWPTHHMIVEESMNYLEPDWQAVFDSLISLVKGGSILPDTWHDLGDTPNHLYYPDDPSSTTGPIAIARWYDYYVGNLSEGNYEDAILSGAIMSHYIADLNIPVHTDEYWPGHSAYETDINSHLDDFTIGSIVIDESILDVQEYVIDAATYAHQYYDVIRDAYPDENTNNQVVENVTIKAITEEQLNHAIESVASLWLRGISDTLAPMIEITTYQKALIDNSHGNDYEDIGELANLISYLNSIGLQVIEDENGITSNDLENIDFLIVTAFENNYSESELNAVSNWISSGNRSVFITGRGDFESGISHAAINDLLESVGTVIRMNDDNVYTVPSDPFYYKDWYIDTENTQAPQGKEFLDVAQVFQCFSPNSLYFTQYSEDVQILVNGTQYHHQTDQNTPGITYVWDTTDDGLNGEKIPLVAAESLAQDNDRVIVFGDTSFSDFSLAPHFVHDNEHFIPVLTEWVLFDNLAGGIVYNPQIKAILSGTEFTNPFTIEYQVSANVQYVDLLLDGEVSKTDSTPPFDSFTLTLNPGTYNVTLVAYNAGGNSTSDELIITVTVDETTESTTTTTTTEDGTPGFTILSLLGILGILLGNIKRKR